MNELILRPYQQEAIDIIESSLAFGSTNLVLSAPTSYGKSAVIAKVAELYQDQGVMISVNIEPLINQIAEFLDLLKLDYSILKAGREKEFDKSKKIQLVMAQTLYARRDKIKFDNEFYMYQQDEAHKEWKTKRTTDILNLINPKVRVSYSATPWDERGYKLHNSETIDTHGITQLVEDGFLCPIKYYVPQWAERVDYSKVKKSGSDYSTKSLDEVVNTPKHILDAITAMNQLDAKNKKTLVFCTTIEQCNHMAKELKADGYHAIAYHSENTKNENTRILDSFMYGSEYTGSDSEHETTNLFNNDEKKKSNHKITCLCSVAKLTTGFSDNNIELGVNLRATQVMSLYHQIAGRMMRIAPRKDFAEFLDLGQCISRFGFPHDSYEPPERLLYDEDSKQALDNATKHLKMEHLQFTLDEKMTEINREDYELKVKKIKSNKKRLSKMTTKELSAKMELEDDPVVIVAILATLFDKIHCIPMKDKWNNDSRGYVDRNGNTVISFLNPGSIEWISELWVKKLPLQDAYHKRKYLKAMRTRSKNLLREKGKIWAIRFFISFLIKEDTPEVPELKVNKDYTVEYDGFDISQDDIPF